MAEKISERTHPLYDENLDDWELYYDSASGGDNFITEDNLFSHRLEDTEDYEERLDRAYFLNFCDAIPTVYNNYIFKTNIQRAPDENLRQFRENVDGRGTNISSLIKKVGYLSSVYGIMHCLIDIPAAPKKVVSLADQKSNNIYPYATMVHPTQLKDWSMDNRGNLNWIIVESTYYEDTDIEKEREDQTHYKVITREKWWIEDEDGNKVKFEDGTPGEGQNTLGMIPLATMIHKDTDNTMIGESMLKDIVYVNRTILNWCSCIDEQIERQTFSQLTVPDAGELAEASETGDDPLHKIGTSSIWTFNAEAKHPPQFISPNVENITTIWKLVIDHIKEIYRMAGLIGSSDDMYVSRSGRAAQMGFLGVNSSLAEKAFRYQKFENDISRLAYLQLGKNPEEYAEVKYPETFDILALNEELESQFSVLERNFSVVLNKQIMKGIARRAVPLAPQNIRAEIENEIDSHSGVVEPVMQRGMPNSLEDGNPNSNLGKTFRTRDDKDKDEISKKKKE